jgi:hypothetical protein
MGNGVICIELLTRMAIWWIPCEVRSGIWRQRSDFLSKPSGSVVMLPTKSQPMGIALIHGPYERRWAAQSSIGRGNISIIGWSKIIEGSNSATIPCVALEHLKLQHVFAVLLTNYEIISVIGELWEKRSRFPNNDELFLIGLQPCKLCYK